MSDERQFAVVVVAGGRGRRLGGDVPKQQLDLGGRPVWRRSVDCFLARPDVSQTVLVRPAGMTFGDEVSGLDCVEGGATRAASVAAGLAAVNESAEFVAVHDAARPLVTAGEVDAVFKAAAEFGAAAPGCAVAATLRRVEVGRLAATIDRTGVFEMQTPQAARLDWIRDALRNSEDDQSVTDEAEALIRDGRVVRLVECGPGNRKITTRYDLDLARLVWAARASL